MGSFRPKLNTYRSSSCGARNLIPPSVDTGSPRSFRCRNMRAVGTSFESEWLRKQSIWIDAFLFLRIIQIDCVGYRGCLSELACAYRESYWVVAYCGCSSL